MPELKANKRRGEIKDHAKTAEEIKKAARADFPRDDLRGDYAGRENKTAKNKHSTHLKARGIDKRQGRTPIR
jgi:hypothetical protein